MSPRLATSARCCAARHVDNHYQQWCDFMLLILLRKLVYIMRVSGPNELVVAREGR